MISPDDVIHRYGEPDMTYEAAGDMGRWYLGSDPGEYKWNSYLKKLYYKQSNTVFIFVEGPLAHSTVMSEEEHERLRSLRSTQSELDRPIE